MKINVRCFAKLADEATCDYRSAISYDLEEGQTVKALADKAGVSGEDVKITFVNGRHAGFDTVLANGDRVGFVPAVGGM
jgi:molybdopterin synthase sulfur carrier subunit